MNLSKFDKSQTKGSIDFSAVMDVQAVIFSTHDTAKNKYSTDKTGATQKANLTGATANNANK